MFRRRRATVTAGFTLMELVMVVAAVGVMAGVALPSLQSLNSSRSDMAAARVRTALIYAQEWAMDAWTHTWVAFDTSAELVSVYVEDPLNPGRASRLAMTDPLTRGAMTVQLGEAGIGIQSAQFRGTVEVEFDPQGAPHDRNGVLLAADGTVVVTGGVTVRVTRGTGLVTID